MFDTWESHENWCKTVEPTTASLIRTRAALRAIPAVCGTDLDTMHHTFLACARFALSGIGCCKRETGVNPRALPNGLNGPELSSAEDMEQKSALRIMFWNYSDAYGAFLSRDKEKDGLLNRTEISSVARTAMAEDIRNAERYDFSGDSGSLAGFEAPLWGQQTIPLEVQNRLQKLAELFSTSELSWSYWSQWYNGFLVGKPASFDLQFQIASLPDEIWFGGSKRVSEKISEISALLNLKGAIASLLNMSRQYTRAESRHGMRGNNPPEDMLIEPQIVRETTIIWAAVDELKAETEKDAPDKSTVLRIVETLGQALKAILAWCAQKGDLSVDTLIKWGIPLGGAAVLANPKLVADVIEAAKVWVPFLP